MDNWLTGRSSKGRSPCGAAETGLQSQAAATTLAPMSLPVGPVTLTAEQIEELSRKLSTLRHDVNNNLSLIIAAAELIKLNPEMAHRMAATLAEQPPKISEAMNAFSLEFETVFGIKRP
jgi:hypothetical protein